MRLSLTKRADYAIRSVLALAAVEWGELVSVRQIASEQAIPVAFLPRVMADLVAAGLVEATAGRKGGYRLRRAATGVSLLEIVEAVEGDVRRWTCILRGGPCRVIGVCAVHPVFAAAQEDVLLRLAGARVADLIATE
jgi:Rrf2 family protein